MAWQSSLSSNLLSFGSTPSFSLSSSSSSGSSASFGSSSFQTSYPCPALMSGSEIQSWNNGDRPYGAPTIPVHEAAKPVSYQNQNTWQPPENIAPLATFIYEPSNSSRPYGEPYYPNSASYPR